MISNNGKPLEYKTKMYLVILLFSLIFSVPIWANSRDCALSDGYIRDHLDNVTDNCDYECGWVKCGDVCINGAVGKICVCVTVWSGGGEVEARLNLMDDPYYCCVDHSPDNITKCSVDRDGFGHCPQGRLVNKKDTCNNQCYSDYKTSSVIGPWSRYRCGERCMYAGSMCLGYPLCPDLRDISECDEDLRCLKSPGFNPSKGVLVSDLSNGHYYCDDEHYHNDGKYDIVTRMDETDLNILSRKVQINYNSITECHNATEFNHPGLMCGEDCVLHQYWCLEGTSPSCGNFSTNNKQLCANTTFWEGKTCDMFYNIGYKAAVGRRCTGATQHCSYPWYTSSIYNYEVREDLFI